ncbi:hypothetical protein EPO56_01480 [Patescibacteria group bacterium]|nr:MAG: hypothetical protein EPO56_01480 [Patescibacteria group bacterium]
MDEIKKVKVTPKDFFLWLGSMVALYVSAVSLILLVHQYITYFFPSPLDYGDAYSGTFRFAIASLIVFFPLYIVLTRMVHQDIRRVPEKKELWVRKWLVVITLFVAGLTIAGDLVALVNTFLNGELTIRFALKALVIFVVLGSAFWYYLEELRGKWEREENNSKIIGGIVTLIVLITVIGGFFIIGSPQSQRSIRLDQERVYNLQNIQYQVTYYWQQKQKLPTEIADLEDPLMGFVAPRDPETGVMYVYEVIDAMSFKLCADFALPSQTPKNSVPVRAEMQNENWQHEKGQKCFERTIDPELFPPSTQPSKAFMR